MSSTSQTVNLLSFQGLPRPVYDAQVAYNLLSGLGESAIASLTSRGSPNSASLRSARCGPLATLAVQVIQAPVFHGSHLLNCR